MAHRALLLICFTNLITVIRAALIKDARTLYVDLLTNYDTRIRPVNDQANTIKVYSEFTPVDIIEFDTTEQKFTVLACLKLTWSDEVLMWNTTLYGGIERLRLPISQIWTPTLILGKAYEGGGVIGNPEKDIVTVTFDGQVTWMPDGLFSFVCEMDIIYYPFDEQTCILTYYVSDETIDSVFLSHDNLISLSQYVPNSEWDLVEVGKSIELKYEANFININFRVQRRASFTTYTVIAPLLMLAFLNVCVFLVPVDSGEKGTYAVTIFLSYGIFITIINHTLPHNSLKISYFVLFLIVLLLLSVLSVFYTVIQAKIVASFGDKIFNCKLRCKKKPIKVDNEQPMNSVDDVSECQPNETKIDITDLETAEYQEEDEMGDEKKKKNEDDEENAQTWRSFLERLDTCLFVAFITLVTVATSIFFALMMQRFGMKNVTDILV